MRLSSVLLFVARTITRWGLFLMRGIQPTFFFRKSIAYSKAEAGLLGI